MGTMFRQIRGIVILIGVQVGLYYFIFSEYKLVDYTFLWAAIYIFAFLLKFFNLGGDSESTPMGKGSASSLRLAVAATVFQRQSRDHVTSEKEDKYDLINLGVLALINAVLVYVLG